MKLVLFADLHLDTPFRWAAPDVARRRRRSLRDALTAVVDLAAEVDADALCCAGDLYEHDMVAPDTGAFVQAAFARLHPLPVLLAPGNHDHLAPASLYARTPWSDNVVLFEQERLTPHELLDGLTVWGGAHRRPAGTPGFLDDFRVDRGGVHIGLFHGSASSGFAFQEDGKQPHAPFDADGIPATGLHHALVGHYHAPVDGPHHTYPGNPEPLSFGEPDTGIPRGAVVVEVDDHGGVVRTRHPVGRTVLHDLTVDLTGVATRDEVRERAAGVLSRVEGVARVTLEGEVPPDVDVHLGDLDGVAPHLEALTARIGRVTVGYDIEAIRARVDTVRGRFVQDVLDADLDDDLRRRVLVTGLRALDGRTDLEVA